MVYLFIGEDETAKKKELEGIKKKYIPAAQQEFNYEIIYAREIDLRTLQEILLRLPSNCPKRVVVIKDALRLSPKIKEFLISYVRTPPSDTILILDSSGNEYKDSFLSKIMPYVKSLNFGERDLADTFKLCDELDRKRIVPALEVLHSLFSKGEKPEMILGGLRYRWERGYLSAQEKNRRLSLLLNCDIEIKRGKLVPEFALEKLCINLCCFG